MSMEIPSKWKRLMFTFIKITKLCFKGKLFYICSLCISKKSVLIIIISRCVDFNFKLFYYIYYMISRWSVYHYWIFDHLCHIIWLSCSFDFGIIMIVITMIVFRCSGITHKSQKQLSVAAMVVKIFFSRQSPKNLSHIDGPTLRSLVVYK